MERNKVLSLPEIKKVLDIRKPSEDEIEKNYSLIFEYATNLSEFSNAKFYCSLNPDADFVVLNADKSKPLAELKNCKHEFDIKAKEEIERNYIWDDFNSNTYKKLNSADILNDGNKHSIAKELIERINSFNKGEDAKGLYIYGNPGVGKTFITAILSNYLSEKYEVAHVFYPRMVMKMKSFGENDAESIRAKFDKIADAKFLIIDDIGAENISQWAIAEVLLNLLQRRQEDNKFTIFTSNYDLNQLTSKYRVGSKDTIGAKRIIKRIEQISDPKEMKRNGY